MKLLRSLAVFVLALAACSPAASPAPIAAPLTHAPADAPTLAPNDPTRPPVAKRQAHDTPLFGKKLGDDYFWLRNKGTPEVEAYLAAENAFTAEQTRANEPLEKALYDEMLARVKEDDSTPPYRRGAWLYYKRFEKGKQYGIYCRKPARAKTDKAAGASEREEIILDLNGIAQTAKFVDVALMVVSDDGQSLAYLLDLSGFRQYTLKVKDLKTGSEGALAIPRATSVAWGADNKTLLYVTEDAQTKRSNKLFRHVLGRDPAKDALVYEEKDEMFELSVDRTRSGAYFVITSESHTTTEARVISASAPTEAPRIVSPREHEHEYYVEHRGDLFYILTNSGGRNFRVVTAPVLHPERASWKELIAHRPDVMIERFDLFADHLVTMERQDALPQITVRNLKTGASERVPQPEATFEVHHDHNEEFKTDKFRFRYESPKTPEQWVDVDMRSKQRTVLKSTEVLGGYDADAYETKRIQAPARDGTVIPVSLVFKKGTSPDHTHPGLLYGYGAYGISPSLSFSSERVSLLDRGFVYAHAHIRGGGDMGKRWHDQGRMMAKMNTFTDFIDVAESLKKDGWVKDDALVVAGGSAGGLLMGAVTNMRPDLFRIVLAYVPFVDVINTMLDESLPLTVGEFEEWGNPKVRADFEYIDRYSPYDNVAAKAYPTMLVRSSYNDSQVMYWEPAKWVAKLRAMKTDKNPLLLRVNMEPAGHGGHAGRYERLHDTAFDYAFVLTQLGIK